MRNAGEPAHERERAQQDDEHLRTEMRAGKRARMGARADVRHRPLVLTVLAFGRLVVAVIAFAAAVMIADELIAPVFAAVR